MHRSPECAIMWLKATIECSDVREAWEARSRQNGDDSRWEDAHQGKHNVLSLRRDTYENMGNV